ncbi:hypothetical protein CIRG_07847 [Coccidioides immitis RMSCC 2394]|uniref:Uncharacterized protein n=1 Tax=Coccidioides immitis RMSCC 2394 TaxID=404692 RepID=A0A0J6YHK6_COCIT|nr:hypothetical protein CIRG_07847 [Coccidioides immitis RMSCC 2394]
MEQGHIRSPIVQYQMAFWQGIDGVVISANCHRTEEWQASPANGQQYGEEMREEIPQKSKITGEVFREYAAVSGPYGNDWASRRQQAHWWEKTCSVSRSKRGRGDSCFVMCAERQRNEAYVTVVTLAHTVTGGLLADRNLGNEWRRRMASRLQHATQNLLGGIHHGTPDAPVMEYNAAIIEQCENCSSHPESPGSPALLLAKWAKKTAKGRLTKPEQGIGWSISGDGPQGVEGGERKKNDGSTARRRQMKRNVYYSLSAAGMTNPTSGLS